MKNLMISAVVFSAMFAALGCGSSDSTTMVNQECTPAPGETALMQYSWGIAYDYAMACEKQVQEESTQCNANKETDCATKYDKGRAGCFYWLGVHVNKETLRTCGAKIFKVDLDATVQINLGAEDKVDTDGDGIPNYWEYQMGLNPCTPNSFGSCYKDAEEDYDKDGIPNGKDTAPICNPEDKTGNGSDCV